MLRLAIISSFVAHGSVGLQATLPAFPPEDFEVSAIPTVVLSNRPGFKACAGSHLPAETVDAIISALDTNGWLAHVDAVFTGYMPTPDHVAAAERLVQIARTSNPNTTIVIDPIMGDEPEGLYIPPAAAEAIRDRLLPLADLMTPNSFELAWLTGDKITDAASAADAARSLCRNPSSGRDRIVIATSVPAADHRLCNVMIANGRATVETVRRIDDAPHGTGDFFAGTFTARLLHGDTPEHALKHAVAATARIIEHSAGSDHLRFAIRV